MDEDLVADLKQFIAATVQQATSDLATKVDLDDLHSEVGNLRSEMNERFA